jgi:hypothetical protein
MQRLADQEWAAKFTTGPVVGVHVRAAAHFDGLQITAVHLTG